MSFSIEQLWHRVLHVIGRGRGTGVGDDSGNVQKQQVVFSGLETQSELKRLGEYGHASMPPDGFDCVAVFIGGDRGNGMIIATGHQASRLKDLLPGESALYDDLGQVVYLTRNGIVIDGKTLPIAIRTLGNMQVDVDNLAMSITQALSIDAGTEIELTATLALALNALIVNATAPGGMNFNTPLLSVTGAVDAAGGFLISGTPAW